MKEMIDQKTWEAIGHYGDAATQEFYARLKKRDFSSTQCSDCKEIAFPPRGHCPFCLSRKVDWVSLPKTGTLYAFTQQDRPLRFAKPDVIGMVELKDVGHILTKIDAPHDSLKIGQKVTLDFYEVSADLTVHQFKPEGA